jgi:hypothetical protein
MFFFFGCLRNSNDVGAWFASAPTLIGAQSRHDDDRLPLAGGL